MKVSTGGDKVNSLSPRAHCADFGEIPRPTVKVRMKEAIVICT